MYEFITDTEQFSEPLGMENGSIPNDAIKASSELDEPHSASRARLNTKPEAEMMGAWVPLENNENQWLQVDLGKVTRLTKIAVQGEAGESSRHVKEFTVSCSLDGEEFSPYREDSSDKVNNYQRMLFQAILLIKEAMLILHEHGNLEKPSTVSFEYKNRHMKQLSRYCRVIGRVQ